MCICYVRICVSLLERRFIITSCAAVGCSRFSLVLHRHSWAIQCARPQVQLQQQHAHLRRQDRASAETDTFLNNTGITPWDYIVFDGGDVLVGTSIVRCCGVVRGSWTPQWSCYFWWHSYGAGHCADLRASRLVGFLYLSSPDRCHPHLSCSSVY